jgi:transposase
LNNSRIFVVGPFSEVAAPLGPLGVERTRFAHGEFFAFRRNDIVVMDNCRVHMAPAVRQAIEKAKASVRYLPKYSPDLNPIELPYSKFKAYLRKVAARTVPHLIRAIRSFIPRLSPSECANYFAHAGYASK